EPLCLECHATYTEESARQGDKYTVEDGVGCESCHGASEKWIASHDNKDATRAASIKAGLTDLVDAGKRAQICTSCHVGKVEKNLPHRIMGAGHPRLSFELDTYAALMPWHWEIDEDYKKRKGEYQGVNYWIAGQVEIANRMLELVLSPKYA